MKLVGGSRIGRLTVFFSLTAALTLTGWLLAQTPSAPASQTPASAAQTPAPGATPSAEPAPAISQNAPEVATRDAAPTFTTRSNLVIVRVVVRDSNGKSIGNLQKDDFQVFDKGKPQYISRFVLEKTTEQKAQQPAPPNGAKGAPLAPDRYVAYIFDDTHLNFGDLAQARNAAEKQLAEMPASTRAAVFTTTGLVTLDFTDDVAKLVDALRRIQPRSTMPTGTDCPDLTYYQADLIQNKNDQIALQAATQDTILCANMADDAAPARGPGSTPTTSGAGASTAANGSLTQVAQSMAQAAASRVVAMGDQETRLTLKVLDGVVRRTSAMPGQRSIVLVSPGFLLLDQRFEESTIMDRAVRANVIINTLNARGLFTVIPGGDASVGGVNPTTMTQRTLYQRDSVLQESDVLEELAAATGGNWFHDNNDLVDGFKRVAAAPDYFYVLGFSPENLKFDGSYHNLKVTLAKTYKSLAVQARRGYYAPKHGEDAVAEAKREVEEALFTRDEYHDLPVFLQTQFFKTSELSAKLSVLARIDVRQLPYKKVEGRNVDTLTVVSGIFDRNGNCVSAIEKTVDMHLKDDTLVRRMANGMTIKTPFDVAPGSYFVRIVVRDAEGQKMAALNGAVEIP